MTLRAWTAALVAAVVASATLAVAPAYGAKPFFGVADVSKRTPPRDLNRLDEGRVGTVRRLLYWPGVEPRPGQFNWAGMDKRVGDLASHGIALLPFIWGSPRYIARHPNIPPVGSARKQRLWRNFLAALANRYGTNGTYWTSPNLYRRQHPGKPPLPIRAWQIWNEPNLKKFFAPGPSVDRYAHLVRSAHTGVHSADPQAKVILAGMSGRGHPSDRAFLNRFYHAHLIKRSFDAVAVNPYASQVSQVGRKVRRIRRVMKRHGDGKSALWITEIGWGSHQPDKFGLNKGVRGQKRMLRRSFRLVVRHRSSWHVRRLIWFDFRDPSRNRGGCSFCTSAGLLKHSGKPKPAWRAFKRFTH
jgi:hypothetical protein